MIFVIAKALRADMIVTSDYLRTLRGVLFTATTRTRL
jgi:hypothetical protein